MTDVLDEARAWLADDPDPDTRAELASLIERAEADDPVALADLGDRFAGRLVRDRRAARSARSGAQPDEPGGGHPDRGRTVAPTYGHTADQASSSVSTLATSPTSSPATPVR